MKDVEAAIADPIDIEGFEDRRPPVKEMISEYRDLIDTVQKELSENDLYDQAKHDDLWILRFLLSHKKNTERALEAAKSTLIFRQKRSLDSKDIRFTPPQDRDKVQDNEPFHRFMDGGVGLDGVTEVVPDKKRGGSIFYFNISSIDTHKLAEVDAEDWMIGMNYVNEWSFQWLDYITRTTGRLTKSVHIVNVEGIYFSMYNMTTQTKYTNAAHAMQDCYPQAVQAYLVCHAPIWIEGPWKLLKPLLPTRVVEKLDFLNPKKYEEDLDRLLQFVSKEYLPSRFGGEYEQWPPATFQNLED